MTHRVAIMQPYLFPYMGYFQLIAAVDTFVLYDDVQFMSPGWINRNRILVNAQAQMFTLPVKSAHLAQRINERVFASNFSFEKAKFLRKIAHSYSRAPFYKTVLPLIERILACTDNNVARFIEHSVRTLCEYLHIETPILISSELAIDTGEGAQSRVIAIVKRVGGDVYINPYGGIDLYDPVVFAQNGIALNFLRMDDVQYRQYGDAFVPFLSIIDVLMFNLPTDVREILTHYSLETPTSLRLESNHDQ